MLYRVISAGTAVFVISLLAIKAKNEIEVVFSLK